MKPVLFHSVVLLVLLSAYISECEEKKSGSAIAGKTPMVEVPAGWFKMGSNDSGDDEKNLHNVYLDGFMIDKYETTASQYAEFLNSEGNAGKYLAQNGYNCDSCTIMYEGVEEKYYKNVPGKQLEQKRTVQKFKARKGFENKPANYVNWYGADAYCRWVGKRLPTEAEWEKAARGTDGRKYPWGNKEPGNNHALAVYDFDGHEERVSDLQEVNSLSEGKSPYGAYHMAGNMWEWVNDWYDGSYYRKGEVENPKGPSNGSFRVLRGGSWFNNMYVIRTSFRYNFSPFFTYFNYGFRCSQ
ncbi:MAG: SUMF1/EgtB/PvdO family nonheme iron enzyme [Nitrospinae bacterium]|nr:SUMF1/EgtB/PvdO family nonheme iron enzyme [Nitrospinota bacterium]